MCQSIFKINSCTSSAFGMSKAISGTSETKSALCHIIALSFAVMAWCDASKLRGYWYFSWNHNILWYVFVSFTDVFWWYRSFLDPTLWNLSLVMMSKMPAYHRIGVLICVSNSWREVLEIYYCMNHEKWGNLSDEKIGLGVMGRIGLFTWFFSLVVSLSGMNDCLLSQDDHVSRDKRLLLDAVM